MLKQTTKLASDITHEAARPMRQYKNETPDNLSSQWLINRMTRTPEYATNGLIIAELKNRLYWEYRAEIIESVQIAQAKTRQRNQIKIERAQRYASKCIDASNEG